MKKHLLIVIALVLAQLVVRGESADVVPRPEIRCAGGFAGHLQGVVSDGEAIYWSFTTELVKTNLEGKQLLKVPVANHHGDLSLKDGKLYVAVNLGRFNDAAGNADSWIYVYDKNDLKELSRHPVPELVYGAGGVGVRGERFYVVGGLPVGVNENYVYEYDADFRFIKRHVLDSGYTQRGIQTAFFHDGRWYFGCYGRPEPILLIADENLQVTGRHQFNGAIGIEEAGDGLFYIGATWRRQDKAYTGVLRFARLDAEKGMVLLPQK